MKHLRLVTNDEDFDLVSTYFDYYGNIDFNMIIYDTRDGSLITKFEKKIDQQIPIFCSEFPHWEKIPGVTPTPACMASLDEPIADILRRVAEVTGNTAYINGHLEESDTYAEQTHYLTDGRTIRECSEYVPVTEDPGGICVWASTEHM